MPKGVKAGGRQKGTPNKATLSIRDSFKKLIEDNIEMLEMDLLALKPAERIKAVVELSKFCVPTLKAVEMTDTTPKDKPQKHIVFVKRS